MRGKWDPERHLIEPLLAWAMGVPDDRGGAASVEPSPDFYTALTRRHMSETWSSINGYKTWVHIDEYGVAERVVVEKHALVHELGVRYRDLLSLDADLPLPFPASILIREKALVINIDAVRLIICANQVYVIAVPSRTSPSEAVAPSLESPFVRLLSGAVRDGRSAVETVEQARVSAAMARTSLPFLTDSRDVEVPYGSDEAPRGPTRPAAAPPAATAAVAAATPSESSSATSSLGGRLPRWGDPQPRPSLAGSEARAPALAWRPVGPRAPFDADLPYELRALEVALSCVSCALTAEVGTVEATAVRVLAMLRDALSSEVLEETRELKATLARLTGRVQRLRTELGDILDDDDDMADMYLARRADIEGTCLPRQPTEPRDPRAEPAAHHAPPYTKSTPDLTHASGAGDGRAWGRGEARARAGPAPRGGSGGRGGGPGRSLLSGSPEEVVPVLVPTTAVPTPVGASGPPVAARGAGAPTGASTPAVTRLRADSEGARAAPARSAVGAEAAPTEPGVFPAPPSARGPRLSPHARVLSSTPVIRLAHGPSRGGGGAGRRQNRRRERVVLAWRAALEAAAGGAEMQREAGDGSGGEGGWDDAGEWHGPWRTGVLDAEEDGAGSRLARASARVSRPDEELPGDADEADSVAGEAGDEAGGEAGGEAGEGDGEVRPEHTLVLEGDRRARAPSGRPLHVSSSRRSLGGRSDTSGKSAARRAARSKLVDTQPVLGPEGSPAARPGAHPRKGARAGEGGGDEGGKVDGGKRRGRPASRPSEGDGLGRPYKREASMSLEAALPALVAANGATDPHDIEEVEDQLESYYVDVDALLRRLTLLTERIDATEDLLEIRMDHRRNELVALDLIVTIITAGMTWVAMVAGFFGMNLFNSTWEGSKPVFIYTCIVCGLGAMLLVLGGLYIIRKRKLMFIPTAF